MVPFCFFTILSQFSFLFTITYIKIFLIICKTNFYLFVSIAVFIPNSTWFGILPQKESVAPRLETTEPPHKWKRRTKASWFWYGMYEIFINSSRWLEQPLTLLLYGCGNFLYSPQNKIFDKNFGKWVMLVNVKRHHSRVWSIDH